MIGTLTKTRGETNGSKVKIGIAKKITNFFMLKIPLIHPLRLMVQKKEKCKKSQDVLKERRREIVDFSEELGGFGFDFSSMIPAKPRTNQEVKMAFFIAETISGNKDLKEKLFSEKQLPITELTSIATAKKSFLLEHHAYIIGLVILFASDYKLLKDYWIEGIFR